MPLFLELAIAFFAGGALGFFFHWLITRGRSSTPTDSRLEDELRRQNAERETLLNQLRSQLAETGQARAAAEARRESAEHLLAEQRQVHERNLMAAKQTQDQALTDLRAAFRALSAEVLQQTAPEFLRLAEQSLGKFQ